MRHFLLTLAMSSGVLLVVGLWIPLKAVVAQELLTLAWAESQARQTPVKPWPWLDSWPVAQLVLPDRDQPLIVLAGARGQSLAFGPGEMTAGPDAGPRVIAGHRDTHFRSLGGIAPGNRIRLQDRQGQWHDYRVTDVQVVDSRHQAMDLSAVPADALLLVTCYPFDSLVGNHPLRFLVEARPVRQAASFSAPQQAGMVDGDGAVSRLVRMAH